MQTSYPCRTGSEWHHRAAIEKEYQRLSKKQMKEEGWAWDLNGVRNWEQACSTVINKARAKLRPGYARVYTF